jgi:proteic killer suppression protein
MIRSFKHGGLEKFFRTGSKAGIQPAHAAKLNRSLIALNIAKRAEAMDVGGWEFHSLKGALIGHFAVKVNGNWHLTFRFVGTDAEVVDYRDYH